MASTMRGFIRALAVLAAITLLLAKPQDLGGWQGLALPSSLLPHWAVQGLSAAWWYALAWCLVTGFERFLWRRLFGSGEAGLPRQRKLLTDVFGILIYAAATAIVVVEVFKQPVTGLFATSGIIAIVLGLALQNTLGDLFAGIALNVERPFKAGDWLSLDGQVQGLVLVTNWRSTHLRLRTADVLIVPNSQLAKSRITNHARPTPRHLDFAEIPLCYGFDGPAVTAVLDAAARGVPGVMADPGPIVLIHTLQPHWVTWRVYVFTEDFGRVVILRGQLAMAIHESLRREGFGHLLPRPQLRIDGAPEAGGAV